MGKIVEGIGVRSARFAIPGYKTASAMARDRRASVVVEFALIAIPFFMLLFGVLEAGLIFFGNTVLDKATEDAARLVRTGQAQAANMTASQFHDYICNQISPLLSCSGLQVDVESFGGFGSVSIPNPIKPDGTLDSSLNNYSIGGSGAIVLVRTFYSWDIITPLLRPFFANLANGQRLMSSAATFRNEPF